MPHLTRPYHAGNQGRSAKWRIRKCGCAAVAMTDLILYLTGRTAEDYDLLCRDLQLKYLPMVPPFGITGVTLAAGISLYAKQHALPISARWNFTGKDLLQKAAAMLEKDLPVILSIGPGVKKLNLYRRSGHTYTAVTQVKGHYVTVVAMDDTWLEIRSWGKQYYIHQKEYMTHGRTYTTFAVHNLVELR